jgi:hypothetical protein
MNVGHELKSVFVTSYDISMSLEEGKVVNMLTEN